MDESFCCPGLWNLSFSGFCFPGDLVVRCVKPRCIRETLSIHISWSLSSLIFEGSLWLTILAGSSSTPSHFHLTVGFQAKLRSHLDHSLAQLVRRWLNWARQVNWRLKIFPNHTSSATPSHLANAKLPGGIFPKVLMSTKCSTGSFTRLWALQWASNVDCFYVFELARVL